MKLELSAGLNPTFAKRYKKQFDRMRKNGFPKIVKPSREMLEYEKFERDNKVNFEIYLDKVVIKKGNGDNIIMKKFKKGKSNEAEKS